MSDELELLPEDPPPWRELPAHPLYGGEVLEPEGAPEGDRCPRHPKARANGTCAECKRLVCGQCRILAAGRVLCPECRGAQAWRTPWTLRLGILLGWATLGVSGLHRWLDQRPPDLAAPWLPAGTLGLPAQVTAVRWGAIVPAVERCASWSQLAAAVVVLVALAHARSAQAQTGRLAVRILLACALAGAAIVVASDAAWGLIASRLR